MKRFIISLIVTLCVSVSLYAEDAVPEYYPGRVSFITPMFLSSYTRSFTGNRGGGDVLLGIGFNEFLWKLGLGVTSGYSFLTDSSGTTLSMPRVSARGMIGDFVHNRWFDLVPFIEGGAEWQIQDIGVTARAFFQVGADFDFLIFRGTYLTVEGALSLSIGDTVLPRFSIGIGIKKPFPVLWETPPFSMEPEISTTLFSPDGDGIDDRFIFFPRTAHGESCREWEYVIRDRRGAVLKTWSGRGTPPESIAWDGYSESGELVFSASDYFYSFTAVDILGNRFESEGGFGTDIFIQIIDGKRKILIPDFVFPAQSADISLLPPEEREKDMDIVSRLSRMLARFPEYKILIEGHANMVNWESEELSRREQVEELLPLSLSRAEKVRDLLVMLGIDRERLEVAGMGGESPLVPFGDEEQNWKNRRVEFILLK
jgi:hypothetical protein